MKTGSNATLSKLKEAQDAIESPGRATCGASNAAGMRVGRPSARDCHITEIANNGRIAWQKATGYNQRSRVETLMGALPSCLVHAEEDKARTSRR